jgi:hypothetical protein
MASRPSDRPLPPRRPASAAAGTGSPDHGPVSERPLPPRPAAAARPDAATVARAPRPAAVRPGRPDPRPMRVVYGASAVAVAGVITAGLFQPVTTPAAADSTTDPLAAQSGIASGVADQVAPAPDVVVTHVIKYIHLKPGQTAPPGATVITPDAPAPRVVVTHNAPANQPAPKPAARPAPKPTPPPVQTRTSGHP